MADVKILITFCVLINLVFLLFGVASSNPDPYSNFLETNLGIGRIDDENGNIKEITFNGTLTGRAGEEYDDMQNIDEGRFSTSVITFIDTLKIIFGFITLFTPAPFLFVLANMQMYWVSKLLIGIPVFILFIFSIVEFYRGGS